MIFSALRKSFYFFIALVAIVSVNFARDLEWQKIELEDKIDFIYRKNLLSQFSESDFIIKTNIKYNDPGMPRFDDLNKDTVKISDFNFDDSKGDYIAFSKVGLEVPILDKYYQDHQAKLKELYRYNESFNLFKNIESIKVSVILSKQLSDAQVQTAKNVVNNIEFTIGDVKPSIEFKVEDIQLIKKEDTKLNENKEKQIGLWEILQLLGKFGNAIGMIVTALLLGFLAFRLLNKYIELLKDLNQQEKEPEENTVDNNDATEADADAEVGSDHVIDYSFDRFEKMLEFNLKQAVVMIKKWINANDLTYEKALAAVAQQARPEKLEKLFAYLNTQEREIWTAHIGAYLELEELQKTNKFITEEIIKEMVSGSFVDDFELVDLILKLDLELAKQFIHDNKEYGPYLLNLLSSSLTSRILDDLDNDEVTEYIKASLSIDTAEIMANKDAFKDVLSNYYAQVKPKPFNFKIQQIISDVSPEKEAILYEFISKQKSKALIVETALKNLPGQLILDLPRELLKQVLQNYPMEKKINLIQILEEENAGKIMSCFPEGSNAREMINMELQSLRANELQLKRVESQREDIWKHFVSYVRNAIKSDREYSQQINSIVSSWATELLEKEKKTAA